MTPRGTMAIQVFKWKNFIFHVGEAHTHTDMKSVQLSHLERCYTSKDTGNYNGSINI